MSEMKTFSEFRARRFLKEQLMRPVKAGRIVHAQLFSGPEGTGKHTAALLVARSMNCTGAGEKPCNACPSCLQFLSGNSPNLIEIKPEKNLIRIGAVRDDILKKISLRPDTGKLFILINEADKMNENAQNALLKTLEEAPEYAAFILITDKPGALLPTIRSRCALYRFAPLNEEETAEILIQNGVDDEKAVLEAQSAEGSPGRAISRIKSEAYQELLKRAISALESIRKKSDVAAAFSKIEQDKESGNEILGIYEFYARRMMRGEMGENKRLQGGKLLESVIYAKKQLKANVAYQSVMEILFFDAASQEETNHGNGNRRPF
ncbi:MAG: DNA polymerase III subunit delta' [Clostridia bacterium]|nr:DNA polymerase III subunit delta' [Clostridia bacterium]